MVENLDDGIWTALATALGVPMQALRHESIASTWTSVTYVHEKLREMRCLPWSLAQGDIHQNLADLAAIEDAPVEFNSLAIREGIRAGLPASTFDGFVGNLNKVSCSSITTEQGHKATNNVLQSHKTAGVTLASTRANLNQFRQQVTPDKDSCRLAKLDKRIAREARRTPESCRGRQVFVMELSGQAKLLKRRGRAVAKDLQKQIVALHGVRWRGLSPAVKAQFEHRAVDHQRLAAQVNGMVRRKLAEERLPLQARVDEASTGPFRVSRCKLSVTEQEELCRAYDNCGLTDAEVASLRRVPHVAVTPPPPDVRAALDSQDVSCGLVRNSKPPWVSFVTRNRCFFRNQVFEFRHNDSTTHRYQLTLASQNPQLLGFIGLRCATQSSLQTGSRNGFMHQVWPWLYKKDLTDRLFTDSWPIDCHGLPLVLGDACNLGGGHVGSSGQWKLLSSWMQDGDCDEESDSEIMPVEEDIDEEEPPIHEWANCPWLYQLFEDSKTPDKQITTKPLSTREARDDVPVEHVFNALDAAREHWAAVAGPQENDFAWMLRGGKWTADHTDVKYDCFRGYSRTVKAKNFCAAYHIVPSMTRSINKFGEASACHLCVFWAAKMQYLLNQREDHGPGYVFTDADLRNVPESAEIAQMAIEGSAVVREAIESIRLLRPVL